MATREPRTPPATVDPPENEMSEDEIDESLEGSFPASDPPSWTLGTNHGRDISSERSTSETDEGS
jgi:hypothetical protein